MTSVENNTCWTGTASTHGTNSTNTATATCTTVKTEAEIVPSETKTNIQIQGKYRIISLLFICRSSILLQTQFEFIYKVGQIWIIYLHFTYKVGG